MIKPMVMVFTCIKTELDMRVNGKMIFSTGLVKRFGPITVNMKGITKKVKNMEKVCIFGKMAPCTMAIGTKTELKDMENINGRTAVNT